MISKILSMIKKNLHYLIIVSIVFGMFYGYYYSAGYLKNYVNIVLFLMIYPMMINLKVTDVFKSVNDLKQIIYSVLINFIFVPILAFILGRIFLGNNPMLFTGLILIALIPTSGMTASWTGLAKGNLKLSLVMIAVNMLIAIPMLPIYMRLFLGEIITIETIVILKSLTKVIIIPLILGDLTRRLIIFLSSLERYKSIKPSFSGISSIGVILIVFIAIALKSKTIVNQFSLTLLSLIPLIIFYILILFVSHKIGQRYLNEEDKISLVYSTSMRNLTIALGIALSSFGESLAVLIIAISYIVQPPIASLYMKYILKPNKSLDTVK